MSRRHPGMSREDEWLTYETDSIGDELLRDDPSVLLCKSRVNFAEYGLSQSFFDSKGKENVKIATEKKVPFDEWFKEYLKKIENENHGEHLRKLRESLGWK